MAIMPKEHMHRAPRQRPVSRRFCRSRNLRCSREGPCSNCVSRGIRCELERIGGTSSGALSASEVESAERIRKLEELVANLKQQQNDSVKQHSRSSDIVSWQVHNSALSPRAEHLDHDVAWLESIYSSQDPSVHLLCLQQESEVLITTHAWQDKIPSNKVVFRICSIRHIIEAQSCSNRDEFLSSANLEQSRCV